MIEISHGNGMLPIPIPWEICVIPWEICVIPWEICVIPWEICVIPWEDIYSFCVNLVRTKTTAQVVRKTEENMPGKKNENKEDKVEKAVKTSKTPKEVNYTGFLYLNNSKCS